MKVYVGVKIVKAEPQECQKDVYNSKVGDPGYKVVYEDGYTSWSPASPFEKAYRPINGMTCGMAIEAAKNGEKVARNGWNGKGMYVVYQKAYPEGIPINKNTAESTGIPVGTVCRFLPYLMLKTADGAFVPWLISQTDALADDWSIIEDEPQNGELTSN